MKKRFLPLFLPLFLFLPLLLCACNVLSGALTDKDVATYIQAYKNISAATPELEKLKSENQAVSLFTCGPCRARLTRAVQQAGYADLKSFMAMDIRMHVTLRAYLYVEITRMGGEVGKSVAAEDFCKIKENIARSSDPKEMALQCERLRTYSGFLAKAGAIAVKLAEKLLKEGDIEMVAKHFKQIVALGSLTYPEEFSGGGGYDD